MSFVDWIVLCSTLAGIIFYGIWKSRGQKNIEGYLLGNQSLPWYHVMFSVMATQASAITFLSAPGQAYTDGMRFVQYYFGLPLAMIVVAAVFIPVFHRLKVYTAYEYLENRFDSKTRSLAATLFLIQRGLGAGITIYAPALILSSLLGWNIYLTNIVMGGLVIFYTVAGGTKAVSYTQLQQMTVIIIGMFIAGFMVVKMLPEDVSMTDALHVAGTMGKLNVITTDFNPNDKYNIWSGLIGGFFLALAYFGTDQSQVGRYLSGKSIAQSRTGMLLNGMVKIPMQFFILLIGVLLFTFYQFHHRPIFFNKAAETTILQSEYATQYKNLEREYNDLNELKVGEIMSLIEEKRFELPTEGRKKSIQDAENKMSELRTEAIQLIKKNDPTADTNDTNYIFLHFVITFLPIGLIGLLIAVIFSASWSSTASELNALASTTVVDFIQRYGKKDRTERNVLMISRLTTVGWGIIAIGVAMFANRMGSLIEAVNVLGSLFYGTMLGIFLVAFMFKFIKGNAVFYAAILAEVVVVILFIRDDAAFLWLNMIGCIAVILFSILIQTLIPKKS
ncbi:MAG TPA: sodium:solute symporter [Flavobacteriales bacterium]|nr:sodium:solute symporter [Flavobacteriales bacterium]HRJ38647.1 sodium:solute symporter [Flavobacteriales bacterium]